MAVAALVTWLVTAAGGFVMLGIWVANGGPSRPGASRFPPALIFGHFALAAIGLVVWIVYLVTDEDALAWTALVLLLPVALLGFTMLARWLPAYRARGADVASRPAEGRFPAPVVAGHGLFAVATVVLVLLTALEV